VRCVSAGAERREGVLCVAPAYVVSPQGEKKTVRSCAGLGPIGPLLCTGRWPSWFGFLIKLDRNFAGCC
jgi:hypothetical protein